MIGGRRLRASKRLRKNYWILPTPLLTLTLDSLKKRGVKENQRVRTFPRARKGPIKSWCLTVDTGRTRCGRRNWNHLNSEECRRRKSFCESGNPRFSSRQDSKMSSDRGRWLLIVERSKNKITQKKKNINIIEIRIVGLCPLLCLQVDDRYLIICVTPYRFVILWEVFFLVWWLLYCRFLLRVFVYGSFSSAYVLWHHLMTRQGESTTRPFPSSCTYL